VRWVADDGGRADAGFKGVTGDCVTRAIAIASGQSYKRVYDDLHEAVLSCRPHMAKLELRYGQHARRHASPRTGVHRRFYEPYLFGLGFLWTPTMSIGSGTTVHLREDELPGGRLVVAVSKHLTAVIDGAIHDTFDQSRDGERCVYGYYRLVD